MDGKIDGGPAFPVTPTMEGAGQWGYAYPGMTLRDWFAGQALPTIIEGARKILIATEQMPSADRMARAAYVLADAMLAERVRKEANDGR